MVQNLASPGTLNSVQPLPNHACSSVPLYLLGPAAATSSSLFLLPCRGCLHSLPEHFWGQSFQFGTDLVPRLPGKEGVSGRSRPHQPQHLIGFCTSDHPWVCSSEKMFIGFSLYQKGLHLYIYKDYIYIYIYIWKEAVRKKIKALIIAPSLETTVYTLSVPPTLSLCVKQKHNHSIPVSWYILLKCCSFLNIFPHY